MGRVGVNRKLKREKAPKIWPIHRKEFVFTFKPVPGPHPIERSIPLALILRDMLNLAKFAREANKIVKKGMIKVDGRVIREPRFPVGMMDVLSIPEIESVYRVFPSKKGLMLHPIGKEEENVKLCRIESKRLVKGGRIQLTLHDGRNILLPAEEDGKDYTRLDVLKIQLPDQTILDKFTLKEGSFVMVFEGKHRGEFGRLKAIEEVGSKLKSLVTIEKESGEQIQTILEYVFVLGEERPSISIPEVKS
ncbi:30S ribosomal protein S4e [Candidatus Bathyarchaeota archaeon]|nr:MAG: 30S ribosomal protein S4e [Candidatus Bathyarchaeota archaeon]